MHFPCRSLQIKGSGFAGLQVAHAGGFRLLSASQDWSGRWFFFHLRGASVRVRAPSWMGCHGSWFLP